VGRRGELWAGSEEGLLRFNGLRFKVYDRKNAPALTSNFISALAEARDGTFWVGTLDGGLYRFQDGTLVAPKLSGALPSPRIKCLSQDGDTLWVGTAGGLARIQNGILKNCTPPDWLPDPEITAVLGDGAGGAWYGTQHGAAHLTPDGYRPLPAGLRGSNIHAFLADPGGALWVGTSDRGLARVQGDRVTFQTHLHGLPLSVLSLHRDRDRNLWLGTEHGLARLNGSPTAQMQWAEGRVILGPPRPGQDDQRVWAIVEDPQGSLWAGTEGSGILRFTDGDLTPIGLPEGLQSELATVMLEDRRGDLYLGTYGGLVVLPQGNVARKRILLSGHGLATTLLEEPSGALWVGTSRGALGRIQGNAIQWVTPELQGGSPGVSSLLRLGDGTLLVGTFQGLFQLQGSRLVPSAVPGFPEGLRVNVLRRDAGNNLWVGSEGHGAYRCRPGGIFQKVPGLPEGRDVTDFLPEPDGTLWIASMGAGLWRYQDGKVFCYTTRDGLPDDSIWRLLDDGLGQLWASSNRGIFRLDRKELEDLAQGRSRELTPQVFDTADGMRSRDCMGGAQPCGWRGRDGRLWFPTSRGPVVVNPSLLHFPAPPQALLEQALVDGREAWNPGGLDLPPGANRLEFPLTALYLAAPERVNFRYRLDGRDTEWVAAGDTPMAHFMNIKPGRYTLRVEARIARGSWGPPALLPVTIRPRYYQTWWFSASSLLVALAALLGIHRMRMAALRSQERILERRVQEALAKVRQLSSLLPLCAWCNKVKDDEGDWQKIDSYLKARANTSVTHGICPECAARVREGVWPPQPPGLDQGPGPS
jgi:ligand-binding sensor domain-containing protein